MLVQLAKALPIRTGLTKVRQGQGDQVRQCKFTNYCEALDQRHKQVTCQLWDRKEIDKDTSMSIDGKRRLVALAWNIGEH